MHLYGCRVCAVFDCDATRAANVEEVVLQSELLLSIWHISAQFLLCLQIMFCMGISDMFGIFVFNKRGMTRNEFRRIADQNTHDCLMSLNFKIQFTK